jgi:hypothetical protein
MDRAELGDEPLTIFGTTSCFLVLNFFFFRGIAEILLFYVIEAALLQMFQSVLATL